MTARAAAAAPGEKGVDVSSMGPLTPAEKQGMAAALAVMVVYLLLLAALCVPDNSPLRAPRLPGEEVGSLTAHDAPLMRSIIPIIFLVFLAPGVVYGYVAGTVTSHRDIFKGMAKSMSTMGYYLVLAFFAALFTYSFAESNLGALLAVKGAKFLAGLGVPPFVVILGIILLSTMINLLIGSASAKWAILGPVFVPMLMQLGLSPELTQAAYRIGDSSTNIITPLLPYFPLIVVYAQRYVKATGVGTVISLTLPYSICFLATWTVLLMIFWALGIPLGIDAPYTYSPGQ
jgi:aminobenzoyl-glutamate transport protein